MKERLQAEIEKNKAKEKDEEIQIDCKKRNNHRSKMNKMKRNNDQE